MRIVDVCAFYAPKGGGVKTYIDRKLEAGPRHGHEIVVLAPGERHAVEERGPGARIVWIPAPRFPLDGNYRYFAADGGVHAALDRLRPDFIEAGSPWRSAEMAGSWPGAAPRALVMHSDPLSAYAYRWFEPFVERGTIDKGFGSYWRHLRRLDRAFDLVVSASADLSARLSDGGLRRVVTHPMGVAPGLFSPELRDPVLRAGLLALCGLPEDAILLIGVGRHAPEKRWTMIVDAATAAGCERPIALVLVGDGRERARIVRQIGGNPHIQLLAPIADRAKLARLMASADALIHGCEAETFCMVAAEARASGIPLIVPDEGGAADHARETGGEMFRAGDASSAARAILRIDARRDAVGEAARARAASVRTMDDHFSALFAHYEAVTAGNRAAA